MYRHWAVCLYLYNEYITWVVLKSYNLVVRYEDFLLAYLEPSTPSYHVVLGLEVLACLPCISSQRASWVSTQITAEP